MLARGTHTQTLLIVCTEIMYKHMATRDLGVQKEALTSFFYFTCTRSLATRIENTSLKEEAKQNNEESDILFTKTKTKTKMLSLIMVQNINGKGYSNLLKATR